MPKDESPKKPHQKQTPGLFLLRDWGSTTAVPKSKVYKSIESVQKDASEPPSPTLSPSKSSQFFHIFDRSPTPEPLAGLSTAPQPDPYFIPTDIFDAQPPPSHYTPDGPGGNIPNIRIPEPPGNDSVLTDQEFLYEMVEEPLDDAVIEAQLVGYIFDVK